MNVEISIKRQKGKVTSLCHDRNILGRVTILMGRDNANFINRIPLKIQKKQSARYHIY